MRIAALSDMHGRLVDVPDCDICIIGGDVCPVRDHNLSFQRDWLRDVFNPWLKKIPAKHVVGVAGNHDLIFDHGTPPKLNWTYLQDSLVEIDGIRIYGTPYQAKFGWWPFMRTEWELERLWRDLPACDIIVSHGPPFGAGDEVDRQHTGMKALAVKLQELSVPVCICGHIHEHYGVNRLGNTVVRSVSVVDENYALKRTPMVFEFEKAVEA